MNVEIRSDVPIPKRGAVAYPILKLEAGDSFFVDAEIGTDGGQKAANTLRSFVSRYHRRLRDSGDPRRFRVSRYDDNYIGVWRVQ